MLRRSLKFFALTSATLHAELTQDCVGPASVVSDSPPVIPVPNPANLDSLKPICEVNTIIATNKPPTMRIGQFKGKDTPLSCMKDGSQQSYNQQLCDLETQQWKDYPIKFNPQREKLLLEVRKQIELDYTNWFKDMNGQLSQFKDYFIKNPEKHQIVQLLFSQLGKLKTHYLRAKESIKHNLGNCGEQSATAAIELLQHVQKENLKFKIFLMKLTYQSDNHRFVLIKNNSAAVPSPKLTNDPIEIRKILKNLKQSGFICDRWNNGLFISFKEDKSNLFDHKADSRELELEEVFFDFSSLRSLNMPTLQKIYCNELDKMNLAKDAEATCADSSSFSPPTTRP